LEENISKRRKGRKSFGEKEKQQEERKKIKELPKFKNLEI